MVSLTNMAEEFAGLSTDEKPTEGISNGSSFIEMDTGKTYFFDEESSSWIEWVVTPEDANPDSDPDDGGK